MPKAKPNLPPMAMTKGSPEKALAYFNYVPDPKIFLLVSTGWVTFDVSDQAVKQQIMFAFANPKRFSVSVWYEDNTALWVAVGANT